MFSSNTQDDHNVSDLSSTITNINTKSQKINIHSNQLINDENEINNSSSIFDTSFPYMNEKSNLLLKLDDLCIKQIKLEEIINDIQKNIITHDLIDNYKKQIEHYEIILPYMNNLEEFKDKWTFFRLFIWRFCLDIYNWKSLAHSIYHIDYLVNNLDNYQIKEFIQKKFKILLNSFILFIKDIITTQIKSEKGPLKDQTTKQNESSRINSRPYITFELDDIRKYQRQALLKSPYGAIPLYRRQAWVAAANLSHDHSLHLLRHMQNSLRIKIHHLFGYDPSHICNRDKKKKIKKNSVMEIFNTSQDILIVGNNNKLYRGRINSCQIIPLKTTKEKKSKIKTNVDENNEILKINFDQLDQTNKTIADEHLFDYLDWETQFNEQDLPDELCEELFHHWKSIIFEDQPCICNSKSKSILSQEKDNQEYSLINTQIHSSTSSLKDIYDDRCICSDCSCNCEKYGHHESKCICSQCSCTCLKDFQSENQDYMEDLFEICEQKSPFLSTDNNSQDHLTNEINMQQEFQLIPNDQASNVERIQENDEEDEIIISDCFLNRIDQWTQQFDLFQDTYRSCLLPEENNCSTLNDSSQPKISTPIAFRFNMISNPLELDDPTLFRQRILDHHRQRK
ncbi:unnamed protein product [Rotaria sp. Silwood1]|nr:unnamed protein product [Rotaria sp. Silwood1]CAF0749132.1 unnamed protein product [Rotaria sp. Silwood1]CAF3329240.1 unnamed protein product [Rotaria sp. Silwood1]CAF3348498.1 unnamed protein product [Rotaria sp. Silwood1]CAF4525396.1 unnamed protein product [Rotaria sp. Silwood1]